MKFWVLALWLLASGLWGLDVEVSATLDRTLVAVVAGPPGTPTQEVGVDRSRLEIVGGHKQVLGWGFAVDASLRGGLDTLPSADSRVLPGSKLEASASILEGWLTWEPVAGVFGLGVGKRLIQPSSGFSHKPLDWLSRADEREGRSGAQAAWFGDSLSASVFVAPALPQDGTEEAFVLARVGTTLGAFDFKTQYLQKAQKGRGGAGFDSSWGEHLTLRGEVAGDASASLLLLDALGGLTWTADDLSTWMVEGVWDDSGPQTRCSGFLRASTELDPEVQAQAWVKAEARPDSWSSPLSGWMGLGANWVRPHWSLEAAWRGAWGPSGTSAGDSPLRWQTQLVLKAILD